MNDLIVAVLIISAITVILGLLPLIDWSFDKLSNYLRK